MHHTVGGFFRHNAGNPARKLCYPPKFCEFGANAADLSDVYFVTGVYGEESHFSNGKTTHYARAVSLVDGSISDIKLDKDDAGALDKYKDDKGDYKEAAMLCTFDDDVATEWSGGDDYEVVGAGEGTRRDASGYYQC